MSESSSKQSKPLPSGATNWLKLKQTLDKEKGKTSSTSSKTKDQKVYRKTKRFRQDKEISDKADILKKKEVWFDDMDIQIVNGEIIAKQQESTSTSKRKEMTDTSDTSHGTHVAIDCEMVSGGTIDCNYPMVGRCSIVNCHGNAIYDKYVKPLDTIVSYNTPISGIKPIHLKDAPDFYTVQREVADILNGKVLIGHDIEHDLKVLFLSHPQHMIRDTAKYPPFKMLTPGPKPGLSFLAKSKLGLDIQKGAHDSVEDASVTMKLYQMCKKEWEKSLSTSSRSHFRKRKTVGSSHDSTDSPSKRMCSSTNSTTVSSDRAISTGKSKDSSDAEMTTICLKPDKTQLMSKKRKRKLMYQSYANSGRQGVMASLISKKKNQNRQKFQRKGTASKCITSGSLTPKPFHIMLNKQV